MRYQCQPAPTIAQTIGRAALHALMWLALGSALGGVIAMLVGRYA